MHIITVANQKGGVGKTSTSLALCAGFARKGFKVLGIDLDPQSNFTKTTGVQNDENVYTAYSVLKKSCNLEDAIQKSSHGFDVIPCGNTLSFLEGELSSQLNKNFRLKEQIEASKCEYDYIVIDVPPSLGLYTLNALTASNEVIIPSLPDSFSLDGIVELYRTIEDVKKYNGNPDLKILGIVFTMYDPRPSINQVATSLAEQLSDAIKIPLFSTRIRVNITVRTAQAFQTSIFDYKKANAAQDYANLIEEIIAVENAK